MKNPDYLYFVTHATLSVDDTFKIIQILCDRSLNIKGSRKKDICYATFNRQRVLKELVTEVETMFVVVSNDSSNINKLLELERCFKKSVF